MKNTLIKSIALILALSSSSMALATMEAAWSIPETNDALSKVKVHCPEYIYLKVNGKMVQKSWTHEVISNRSANDAGECVFD